MEFVQKFIWRVVWAFEAQQAGFWVLPAGPPYTPEQEGEQQWSVIAKIKDSKSACDPRSWGAQNSATIELEGCWPLNMRSLSLSIYCLHHHSLSDSLSTLRWTSVSSFFFFCIPLDHNENPSFSISQSSSFLKSTLFNAIPKTLLLLYHPSAYRHQTFI